MLKKLANEDDRIKEVRQAMSEYQERKTRETEARYQRRLFNYAENQESIAHDRAEQWEEKVRRIEAARRTASNKERSFRETVKEKLSQKFEKFKEYHSKYHVSRQEAAQLNDTKLDAVRSSKEQKIEERAMATAEKMQRKSEISQKNRETMISEKHTKSQEKRAKVQQRKEALDKSMEISSCKKMMAVNERLDQSAKKRQKHEKEVQEKAKADFERVKEVKRVREERERRFSDCAKENLRMKFEKAEEVLEKSEATRQQAVREKMERERKVASTASTADQSDELRGKIEEKMQRLEANRAAILNAKVQQCHEESGKVKNVKENVEEQIRSQKKAVDEKLQAKLDVYRENRQQRLIERTQKSKASQNKKERTSLQEISNDDPRQTVAAKTESVSEKILKDHAYAYDNENSENDSGKFKELAENFRNRNVEYLGRR